MSKGMKFRRIAPTYSATKWTQAGDHPQVIQTDPLSAAIINTPRGLEHVSIGDWIVEGGDEVVQVVPSFVFLQHYEPTGTHRESFQKWFETREVHPNEIGVDHGVIGDNSKHYVGGHKNPDYMERRRIHAEAKARSEAEAAAGIAPKE